MNLLTNYPKQYLIEYSSLDEIMSDYINMANQMDFIKEYNPDIKTKIEIIVGESEYLLKIVLWKI